MASRHKRSCREAVVGHEQQQELGPWTRLIFHVGIVINEPASQNLSTNPTSFYSLDPGKSDLIKMAGNASSELPLPNVPPNIGFM